MRREESRADRSPQERWATAIVAVFLAGAVLAAVPAFASHSKHGKIAKNSDTVFALAFTNIVFSAPTASCGAAVATYTLTSLAGDTLGTGTSCVQAFTGCATLTAGCRGTEDTIFTYNLAGGSITVRAPRIEEVGTSDSSFMEWGKGTVTGGTGTFKGQRGDLVTGGSITFVGDGADSHLNHVLTLGTGHED